MPDTPNDDLWREEEHEDSCSCSSHPYLVSSSSTEIITVPADPVPLERGMIDKTFLMERLLAGFNTMGTVDPRQYVHLVQRDGGAHDGSNTDTTPAPETAPIQYTDDTVDIVDTQAPDIQDTQATR